MCKKRLNRVLSVLLAFVICLGTMSTSAGGIALAIGEKQQDANKPDFNYVALGASNVNGYGMHGYNFESVYEAPFEKTNDNRYGYEMDTAGSYTDLVAKELSKNYNVNLYQVAMSSWRAEELHFLLDFSYNGDSYTDTWLYDTNGDGVSSNWYYGAALYEWNERADKGLEGYDHTPTAEELLYTLRLATQEKVADADLITVDVGMNNFGTYMLNLLASGIFSNDIGDISPEVDQYYDVARDYIIDLVISTVGESIISAEMLSKFSDTLAYALVGYCVNFDETMKEIYALNPDAKVVVVGIQNMMRDLEVVFPGSQVRFPFGDIFGMVVNAANVYTSIFSPYASRYNYADVSTDGRAEFFIDEIAGYNGNPYSLSVNMLDCINTYDSNFYIETRAQQAFALMMSEKGLVNIDKSQTDTSDINSLYAFHYGYHYGIKNEYPIVTWKNGTPLKDLLKNGADGKLSGDDKTAYETYVRMLNVAYDVTAELLSEATKPKIIDFVMLGKASASGLASDGIILEKVYSAIEKAATDPDYDFDINKEYPDGFFYTISQEKNVSVELLETMYTTAMWMQFGGTVFSHPNANGYKYIADKVLNAYLNNVTGEDVIEDQLSIDYLPSEDSYYVAVGGDNLDYSTIFAELLGLEEDQVGQTSFEKIDYERINKADLVSIGFDDAEMLDFMMNQLSAYIANYISVDARATVNTFISSLIDKIDAKYPFLPISSVKPSLIAQSNATVDSVLENEIFAGKTMHQLDWSEFLDGEQLELVEVARTELRGAIVEAIGFETYTYDIDMVEWIVDNADSIGIGNTILSLLSNKNTLYNIVGDSAVLTIEVPIADALVYSIESYCYKYVEYTVHSAKLVNYIAVNNPDAKIIFLGHFNPLNGVNLEFAGSKLDLGVLFESVSMASTARQLAQFFLSENSGFVFMWDVTTNYQVSLGDSEESLDIFGFLSLYFSDNDAFLISPEGHNKIANLMMNYVNIICEHEYDNCVDERCNKCYETREIDGHIYGEWIVVKEPTKEESGLEERTCEVCGHKETMPIAPPVPLPTPVPVLPIIPIVLIAVLLALIVLFIRKRKKSKALKKENNPEDKKDEYKMY